MTAIPSTLRRLTVPQRCLIAGLALLAMVLAYLILHITRLGIGYSPDSRSYLVAAQYVAKGQGVKVYNGNGKPELFTHLAPLLSIVTGAIATTGLTPQTIDRWLNVLCIMASVGLSAWLCWRLSGKSIAAAIVGPLLLFLDVPAVQLHIILLSEPMFLTLLLGAIVLFDAALRTGRLTLIAAAGAAAGAMALTRYAGVSVLAILTLSTLLAWDGSIVRRLKAAALFGAVAAVLPVAWLAYGYRHTGKVGNRDLAWHPPTHAQVQELFTTLASWIFPSRGPGWTWWLGVIGFFLMLLAAGVMEFVRRDAPDAAAVKTRRTVWCIALGYIAFILISVTLFDAYTPLDARILSPMRATLMPICVSMFLGVLPRIGGRGVFGVMAAGFAAVIAVQTAHLTQWSRTARDQALGFNSTVWRKSATLAYVNTVPKSTVIYTNMADVVFLRCDRFSKPVPQLFTTSSNATQFRSYYRCLPNLWQDLKDHDGIVLYSRRIHRSTLVPATKLAEDIGLVPILETKEAIVYKLSPTSTKPVNLGPSHDDPMKTVRPSTSPSTTPSATPAHRATPMTAEEKAAHDAAIRKRHKRAKAAAAAAAAKTEETR